MTLPGAAVMMMMMVVVVRVVAIATSRYVTMT